MSRLEMPSVVLTEEDKCDIEAEATEIKDIQENMPFGIKVPEFINQKLAEIKKVVEAAGLELKNDGDAVMAVPMDKSRKEKKRKLTPEELHEIRSRASMMRKTHGGGRPKGFKMPKLTPTEETTTISVDRESYNILREMAQRNDVPIKKYFYLVMQQIKHQFQPDSNKGEGV